MTSSRGGLTPSRILSIAQMAAQGGVLPRSRRFVIRGRIGAPMSECQRRPPCREGGDAGDDTGLVAASGCG